MSFQQTQPQVMWRPMYKQYRFLSCPAFEVGYGGAPAGGKSDCMAVAPLQDIQIPNYRALILRRKYSDLEGSLVLKTHELYRGRAEWDGQHKRWRFANGSSVQMGHCKNENDIYNYQSKEYEFIGFEQVEQFTERMYLYFFTRCRTVKPNVKPKIRSNFNPGGIGHQWLKKRFWIHDRSKPPEQMYDVTETLTHPDGKAESFTYQRAFIPATVYDNEHIMKNDRQYFLRLMQLPEPMRTAYLQGRFDLFEGQFFKEWDEKVHVCKPFEIPPDWKKWMAFDWGYSAPACVLWFTEEPKSKTIYVYRELYITEKIDTDLAKEFDNMTGSEHLESIFYPWDLDNDQGTVGVSMHQRMDEATDRKFYWVKGNKDRKNGWAAVRYLLKIRANGEPGMKVFDSCRNLIRTMPEQIFDETNSEDLDSSNDDHAEDSLRYFAATFRPLDYLRDQASKEDQPVDMGTYKIYPAKMKGGEIVQPRQYAFSNDSGRLAMNWLGDY